MGNHCNWHHLLHQNQPKSIDGLQSTLLSNRNITPSGCWEWTKCKSKSGYGKIKWRPIGDLRVHRVAAMLWLNLDIKSPILVCHKCDNPICFNPDHLFLGSIADNKRDEIAKGRNHNRRKTHCINGHEFTPENTWLGKSSGRNCRTCHRTRERDRARRVA
jgi:hypothetical protein